MEQNKFVVKELRAYVRPTAEATASQTGSVGADCHDVVDSHWINGRDTPIATPMAMYDRYSKNRKSWGINALGSVIVEVESVGGVTGVGVSIGGEPGCFIAERHLSRFVEGQDCRNIELIWDQMYKASMNYGRKGLSVQALSAVDLALWDLLGKIRGEPVYSLLGGKTKAKLPVYCTTNRPDVAEKLGFKGAKVPLPYGTADADEGLQKNVEFIKDWRSKFQDARFPLMIDCYMALSVPYTIRLAKALEPYNVRWLEECLHPDDYKGFKEIKEAVKSSGILITTGEHEYARYGFRTLLEDKCADILQPDVTWVGGITETRRIVAMASAYDIKVVPHGSSSYSYHLQIAFPNCPFAEFINLHPTGEAIAPYFGDLFEGEPMPQNGFVELTDAPGFGLTLNKKGLERPFGRRAEEIKQSFNANFQSDEAFAKCDARMPGL